MKKKLMGLVVLGGIAASIAYKLKKEEHEKELLDLEIDLLEKEIEAGHHECVAQAAIEESQPCACSESNCDCENECSCEESCCCEETCSSDMENHCSEEDNEYPNLDCKTKEEIDLQNDSLFTSLENEDKPLEEERPIQHFVEFENEDDLQSFKSAVIEKGYVVTHGDNNFDLSVLHIAPLDRGQLVTHIYYLANQAMQHNGKYKGWNSRVSY